MNATHSFGSWLRQRRKALDLTQPELAEQVACSVTTLQKIEADERRPSKQIAEQLADVLAISVEERAAFVAFARRTGTRAPVPLILSGSSTPTHNLPPQPTPFVGRENDLAQIAERLANPVCRLLTLVGPGGIGKTRLAVEAARQLTFPHGIYLVALQSLNASDLIVPAVAEAIHFRFYPGSEPKQQLLDYLREKSLLMVLDNFEHLLEGAELVSELLTYAPGVKVMATSREALNLQEEWVYPATGMPFPPIGVEKNLEEYSAVQLFVQSARRMRANFALEDEHIGVIRICQLVEGMPLGLELASAWVRALSCAEIASEIERSLDILATSTRNVPSRHRTMRAVLDHSWKLLTEPEQAVFKYLSIFRGGFRKEAAQSVAGATLPMLSVLVDKSLLRVTTNGRYDIHDLLRHYGEEQLNATPDEREQVRDRHSAYYAEFMGQQEEQLKTGKQRAAIDELEVEVDNVRMAWRCMVEKRKAAEIQKSTGSLEWLLKRHHRYQEALELFGQAADALRPASAEKDSGIAYGIVLVTQGFIFNDISAAQTALALAEESLTIFRRFDFKQGMMVAFELLATTNMFLGHPKEEVQATQDALSIAREIGDLQRIAGSLGAMAFAAIQHQHYTEAAHMATEGLAIAEQVGNPLLIAYLCSQLGRLAVQRGDYSEAKRRLEQALRISQEMGNLHGVALSYMYLAEAATAMKDFAKARGYFRQELEIDLDVGSRRWQTDTILHITQLLVAQNETEGAIELLALVRQHPATMPGNRDQAEQRLANLQAELAPEVFVSAVERGRARDLETSVKELIAAFSQPVETVAQQPAMQPLEDSLTQRELDILRHIADGHSNREIADQLVLALGTVKWYISEIYSKLGVASRTQAIARARELGLLA